MTRLRIAQLLAVVAALAVLGTAALAAVTAVRSPGEADAGTGPGAGVEIGAGPSAAAGPAVLVVRDPRTGARFEVPGADWRVLDRAVRIYYEDDAGRPVAVVRGPAVFRSGYCAARPDDSNRGFAGFTRQRLRSWLTGLTPDGGAWTAGVDHERTRLADGTPARLSRTSVFLGDRGPCGARAVEVAMVEADDVRLVVVSDWGEPGTLTRDEVDAVLASLRAG